VFHYSHQVFCFAEVFFVLFLTCFICSGFGSGSKWKNIC